MKTEITINDRINAAQYLKDVLCGRYPVIKHLKKMYITPYIIGGAKYGLNVTVPNVMSGLLVYGTKLA